VINAVELNGELATIVIRCWDGTVWRTLVDADDLARLDETFSSLHVVRPKPPHRHIYVTGRLVGSGHNPKLVIVHRFLTGCPRGLEVDHINHDSLDNRKANLRVVRHAENMQNLTAAPASAMTGVRGVSQKRHGYRARLNMGGREFHLGTYATVEEAARVATAARARLMPFSEDARRAGMLS